MISVDISRILKFINEKDLEESLNKVKKFSEEISNESFPSLSLHLNYEEKVSYIEKLKKDIREKSSTLIVIAIGGSFLGAKACIEILSPSSKVYFSGNSFSTIELKRILEIIDKDDVCINVISKSGSTLEILVNLSLVEEKMMEKYGPEYNKRFYITTENIESPLRTNALKNNYNIIEFEEGVVGRFSVLSTSALIPLCIADIDIRKVLEGAKDASLELENSCYTYAASRYSLYKKKKVMEILSVYEPSLYYFCEWWKQLFGESEGKDGKGIFPSSAIFSRDLHSIGQYIQDGNKFFFETTLNIEKSYSEICLPKKLPFASSSFKENMQLSDINKVVFYSTIEAHYEGEVPNIVINLENITAYSLGYLIYFFQKACYLGCKLLEVDPFNNKAVDLYKTKVKRLLGV